MQTWKSVLNGLLVVAAAAGMFLYIDNATEPGNQPMARDEFEFAQKQRAGRGDRDLMVAEPPGLEGRREEPALMNTKP